MNKETLVLTLAEYEVTCSLCPFQVQGKTIDGKEFYFRCRHDLWRLELDDTTIARGAGYIMSIDDMVTELKLAGIKLVKLVDL